MCLLWTWSRSWWNSHCLQDSSVEHKFEDAQARMSERIRQVSKFSRGRKFCFNRLLHTHVCLLWKTQRIKITFNNNIFKHLVYMFCSFLCGSILNDWILVYILFYVFSLISISWVSFHIISCYFPLLFFDYIACTEWIYHN